MKLDLIGSQNQALSVVISNEVSENCYCVPGRRNPLALVGIPGRVQRQAITGACRGGYLAKKSLTPFLVFGNSLYSVNSILAQTALGAIVGAGRVSMADNGTQLVIVTGTGSAGYVYAAGILNTITDPDFPGADTVDYIDGYFVFSTSDGQWFISALGDGTQYDSLDFVTNERAPDDTLAVVQNHGEIYCFGTATIEPWVDTGNADFPFERNASANIERGLYARFAVAKDDNTLFFLGDDLLVYRLQGYTPVVISDEGTNTELSNYLKAGHKTDLQNSFMFSYTDHGHKFVVLTVPNRGTHVLDLAMNLWHKRKHFDHETDFNSVYVMAYGKHLLGGTNGNLYEWSRDIYDDAGRPLKRLRRTRVFSKDDKRLRYKTLKLVIDSGRGLATGQGSDPIMVIRWSDDNGLSWSNERHISMGLGGDYLLRVITRGLGSARSRLFEYYVTDPVPFVVVDAFASVA